VETNFRILLLVLDSTLSGHLTSKLHINDGLANKYLDVKAKVDEMRTLEKAKQNQDAAKAKE